MEVTMPQAAPEALSEDRPALVVEEAELSALDGSPRTMAGIPGSRMFEIRDALAVYHRDFPGGEEFDASQGDGGASLPGVSPELLERAFALQRKQGTAYDQPFGTAAYRRSMAEGYWGLDASTGWGPENVLGCQGGRDALLKAYDAMQFLGHGRRGDFILVSRVPWISYNWGPYAIGANVLLAPGREAEAWALTPEGIAESVRFAEAVGGRKIAGLVVTSPDNPTGRTLPLEEQIGLAQAAFACGIPFVLFDWIYHRVTDGEPHDVNAFLGAFSPEERDRLLILDGITKSLGASNIRNAHLLASKKMVKFMQNRASHGVIPSFFSLAVAMAAVEMGFQKAAAPVVEPTNASRKVLAAFLKEKGIRGILGKGYYAFLDVGPWMDRAGMADSAAMGAYLAERHGLAVVPGVYFSDFGKRWIRFSYALPPEKTKRAAERLWTALSELEKT
jgi:aspartate/methionine/tyrosine aminotransferase